MVYDTNSVPGTVVPWYRIPYNRVRVAGTGHLPPFELASANI